MAEQDEQAHAKKKEDQAAQNVKAVHYLASRGCGDCCPETEEALLQAQQRLEAEKEKDKIVGAGEEKKDGEGDKTEQGEDKEKEANKDDAVPSTSTATQPALPPEKQAPIKLSLWKLIDSDDESDDEKEKSKKEEEKQKEDTTEQEKDKEKQVEKSQSDETSKVHTERRDPAGIPAPACGHGRTGRVAQPVRHPDRRLCRELPCRC